MVTEVASIHGIHVVNTVYPSLSEVLDQEVSLLLHLVPEGWQIFG